MNRRRTDILDVGESTPDVGNQTVGETTVMSLLMAAFWRDFFPLRSAGIMGRSQVKSVMVMKVVCIVLNKLKTFYLDSFLHPRRLTTLQNGLECFLFFLTQVEYFYFFFIYTETTLDM